MNYGHIREHTGTFPVHFVSLVTEIYLVKKQWNVHGKLTSSKQWEHRSYNINQQDEPSGSKHVEDIVKIKTLV
jgi:hypothetical protein